MVSPEARHMREGVFKGCPLDGGGGYPEDRATSLQKRSAPAGVIPANPPSNNTDPGDGALAC